MKVGNKYIPADQYQNGNGFTESFIRRNTSDWDYFDYLIEYSFSVDGIQQSDNIIAFIVLTFLVAACSRVEGKLYDYLSLMFFIKQLLPSSEVRPASQEPADESVVIVATLEAVKAVLKESIYINNQKIADKYIICFSQ